MAKRRASDSLDARAPKTQRQDTSGEVEHGSPVEGASKADAAAQADRRADGDVINKEQQKDTFPGGEVARSLTNEDIIKDQRLQEQSAHRELEIPKPTAIEMHSGRGNEPLRQAPTKSLADHNVSPSRRVLHMLVVACETRRVVLSNTKQAAVFEARLHQAPNDMDVLKRLGRLRATVDLLRARQKEQVQDIARAVEPSMASKVELDMLPAEWFSDPEILQQYQRTIDKLQQDTAQLDKELGVLDSQQSGLYIKRTAVLLDIQDEDEREQGAVSIDHELDTLQISIDDVRGHRARLRSEYDLTLKRHDLLAEQMLQTADEALAGAGLMSASDERKESIISDEEQPQKPLDAQDARNPATEGHLADNRAEPSSKAHANATPDMRNIVQAGRHQELQDSRRAYSEASRAFRKVRDNYDCDLAEFLRKKEEGRIVGTKTDFDAGFFIARNESNNILALAQERFERAKKGAQRVGVLPPQEQTSDFADRSDDGYTAADVEAYVQTLDREAIERWRRDEDQKNIELDKKKWTVQGASQVATSSSVAAESSCSQERYDVGRRKKHIERWTAHQAELWKESELQRERYWVASATAPLTNMPGGGCHYPLM